MPSTRLRTEIGDVEGSEETKAFADGRGIVLLQYNLQATVSLCTYCVLDQCCPVEI